METQCGRNLSLVEPLYAAVSRDGYWRIYLGVDPVSAPVPRGRYAPSPTGVQHLGNLRTALLAWLVARSNGGRFILRIEDLDLPRVRPGSTAGILADLRWLGLDFDEGPESGGGSGPYFQSARQDVYRAAISRLRADELLYPCFCSRAELARIASAPQTAAEGQRYPGTCLRLSEGQRRRLAAEGRPAALRFHVPDTTLTFTDEVAGRQSGSPAHRGGDFVVLRSDGVVSYQLAVVVDDALMGISQVVRGSDLLPSTFGQLALFAALGYPPPTTFAHVPLLHDQSGARLAKRDSASGLEPARAAGATRDQILGLLASSCGLWPRAAMPARLDELLATFDVSRLSSPR